MFKDVFEEEPAGFWADKAQLQMAEAYYKVNELNLAYDKGAQDTRSFGTGPELVLLNQSNAPFSEGVLSGAHFFEQGADVLITGHIHLPIHLREEVKGRPREVFIMGDWCGGTQDYVEHDGREFRFRKWPLRAGATS